MKRPATPVPASALRVWWIPQVPGKRFFVSVDTVPEAMKLLSVLANYDRFQLENHIKPDYCNTGGLEVLEDGEWVDWYDEAGNNIDDLRAEA